MINLRRGPERGHTEIGWLNSWHSFSFDQYYDPRNMNFRALRVINEDWIAPAAGFPTHPHRDMEIITYVLEGVLEHRDSMGHGGLIRPGEVQKMSAGTGVTHSEFNSSRENSAHLLQIWIQPDRLRVAPSYEQKDFSGALARGEWTLLAAPGGEDGAISLQQDARLLAAQMKSGTRLSHAFSPGRHGWLQVARGDVKLLGGDDLSAQLTAGDAASISGESQIHVIAHGDAELLLFDLA